MLCHLGTNWVKPLHIEVLVQVSLLLYSGRKTIYLPLAKYLIVQLNINNNNKTKSMTALTLLIIVLLLFLKYIDKKICLWGSGLRLVDHIVCIIKV